MAPKLSVSDFIAVVNQTLDYAYPLVEVEGEVVSFKVNQGKFVFFDLKDEGGSVGCFMMVFQLRVPIEDGMKVVVTATPKLTQWGKFSLTVKGVRPSGKGSIKKSFEILRAKLDAEGLFAHERKRTLPYIPQRIAVISSPQAAGYADFVKILNDRWSGLKVDVAAVAVQGTDAPDQIIRALNYFNTLEDLPEIVVLIRGGGSVDDLAAFNDEQLVRAVAASRIPVITGIGHETDISLCDLAADVRAATPSNVAQIIVPDRKEIVRSSRLKVQSITPKLLGSLDAIRLRLEGTLEGSARIVEQKIDTHQKYIQQVRRLLNELDPQRVLERGYAIIRGQMKQDGIIDIETSNALVRARIENYEQK
ncbi:exodeoxyribonuclease VII large subunit [Candidatus Saccharibacteria bacterium]|nr:exodeoxyribonuclease VII large subunit [Candidatus Saccharibacteria bacterium]